MPEMMSPTGAPQGTFVKFHEFSALVEKKDEKPTVYGIATWEKPDSDDEICDYETAVPIYQAWSKKAMQRTKGAGQEISLGNVRLMHGAEIGGKVTSVDFRDDAKEIAVGSEPVNDDVYKQLKGGFLTGYSQGGSYAWRECDICKTAMALVQGMNFCSECGKLVPVRYGLKRLAEVSYVDSPAIGEGFEHVKAGGSRSIIKFQKHKQQEGTAVAKTKTVAGEALEASAFAYVGDASKTSTWKFPIKFADAAKAKKHIHMALARLDHGKSTRPDKLEAIKTTIHAAAKEAGIDLAEAATAIAAKRAGIMELLKAEVDKAAEAKGFQKGLYAVGRFADILESLACLYESSVYEREIEGDESDVPDELKEQLQGLIETFIAMAEEEARELAANKNNKGASSTMEKTAEQLALEKAAKKSLASHFAKAASHHEKMAKVHEAIAAEHDGASDIHEKAMKACQGSMGKATKADVGSDDDGDPVQEVISSQMEFHKAMQGSEAKQADQHEKLSGFHDKMAEHYTKMAEANDESADKADTAAMLKAFREEADPAAKQRTPAPVAAPVTPSMDEDVAKAAAAMRETPEYKDSISAIAKAQVEAEVEALRKKTLAPTGVAIVDANTTKAATPGSVAAVQRGGDPEQFEFATPAGKTSTGGL